MICKDENLEGEKMARLVCVWIALVVAFGALGSAAEPDAATESLRQTEIAFSASVGAQDFEVFLGFIDEQAVFAAGRTLRGREAIGEAWSVFFGPDARAICWEPTTVELSGDGEVGLSTGPYWIEADGEEGASKYLQGTFISTWRRGEDDSWKIIFDAGVEAQTEVADTPACMTSAED
jgi:ketosteroid isomerase-like protein